MLTLCALTIRSARWFVLAQAKKRTCSCRSILASNKTNGAQGKLVSRGLADGIFPYRRGNGLTGADRQRHATQNSQWLPNRRHSRQQDRPASPVSRENLPARY